MRRSQLGVAHSIFSLIQPACYIAGRYLNALVLGQLNYPAAVMLSRKFISSLMFPFGNKSNFSSDACGTWQLVCWPSCSESQAHVVWLVAPPPTIHYSRVRLRRTVAPVTVCANSRSAACLQVGEKRPEGTDRSCAPPARSVATRCVDCALSNTFHCDMSPGSRVRKMGA